MLVAERERWRVRFFHCLIFGHVVAASLQAALLLGLPGAAAFQQCDCTHPYCQTQGRHTRRAFPDKLNPCACASILMACVWQSLQGWLRTDSNDRMALMTLQIYTGRKPGSSTGGTKMCTHQPVWASSVCRLAVQKAPSTLLMVLVLPPKQDHAAICEFSRPHPRSLQGCSSDLVFGAYLQEGCLGSRPNCFYPVIGVVGRLDDNLPGVHLFVKEVFLIAWPLAKDDLDSSVAGCSLQHMPRLPPVPCRLWWLSAPRSRA